MEQKKPLVVLTGPTAVGKTGLSIRLAKAIDGEIISADSMQVYRHMDIGSAKVTREEMEGVCHHLIDVLNPDEEFHVVKFQKMAKEAIKEIYDKGKIPILVGGTGFYIQSVLYDIDFTQTDEDEDFREQLENLAREKGNEFLFEKLRSIDPKACENLHPNNVKRVIRAIEFYEKINKRVDNMLENGLVEEVKRLKEMGCGKDLVSMQGLGYKEILDYLEGTCTLEDAVYRIKRDTRHFAKRQITWFKRERDVIWVSRQDFRAEDGKEDERILTYMLQILRERHGLSI